MLMIFSCTCGYIPSCVPSSSCKKKSCQASVKWEDTFTQSAVFVQKISDNNITSVIALVMRIIRGCSHSPASINNNINWSNYDLQLVLMEKIDCRGNWAVVSVSRNSRDELACANLKLDADRQQPVSVSHSLQEILNEIRQIVIISPQGN